MFVDLDWPLNASSLLSASAELLVNVGSADSIVIPTTVLEIHFVDAHSHGFPWKNWESRIAISNADMQSIVELLEQLGVEQTEREYQTSTIQTSRAVRRQPQIFDLVRRLQAIRHRAAACRRVGLGTISLKTPPKSFKPNQFNPLKPSPGPTQPTGLIDTRHGNFINVYIWTVLRTRKHEIAIVNHTTRMATKMWYFSPMRGAFENFHIPNIAQPMANSDLP